MPRCLLSIFVAVLVTAACGGDATTTPTTASVVTPSTTADLVAPTSTTTTSTTTTSAPNTTITDTVAAPSPDWVRCSPVSADITSVDVGPPWALGTTVNLTVERVEQRPDRPDAMISMPVSLEVVEEDEFGWTFSWRSESVEIAGTGLDADALESLVPSEEAEAYQRFLDGPLVSPQFRYRLGRTGTFEGFEDVDDFRAELEAAVSWFVELIGEATLGEQLLAFYASLGDDQLVATFAPELVTYHYLDGAQLAVADPVVFDDVFPTPVGGESIPAVTTAEVTSLRGESDDCVLYEETTSFDPERTSDVIAESVVQFFDAEASDAEEMRLLLDELELQDRLVAHVDGTTGHVRRLESERVITTPEGSAVDRFVIQDVTGR